MSCRMPSSAILGRPRVSQVPATLRTVLSRICREQACHSIPERALDILPVSFPVLHVKHAAPCTCRALSNAYCYMQQYASAKATLCKLGSQGQLKNNDLHADTWQGLRAAASSCTSDDGALFRASFDSRRSVSLDPPPFRHSPDFLTASSGASMQVWLELLV